MATPTSDHFPIRELVRRTGVNASTLRAWENRHGLLNPMRTESGHRLYGPEDVQRIRRVQELLVQGVGLGEMAPLLTAEPSPRSDTARLEGTLATALSPAWQHTLAETLAALEEFSTERLDALYSESCALYPIDVVTDRLLIPVLEQLGLRWAGRPAGIAEEHFFSAWLRNKLGARLHHAAGQSRGRPFILACLPGEHHEISLLLAALGLLQLGYRVIYLGADMPLAQLVAVVRATHAMGIVLSGREERDGEPLGSLLRTIGRLKAEVSVPVFVGGRFSVRNHRELEQTDARPIGDNMALGLRLIEAVLAAAGRR